MAKDPFDPVGLLKPQRQMTEKLLKSVFLSQRQGMDFGSKIAMSLRRIRHGYEKYDGNVYIALSGGADSTVLADMVWSIYPDVPAVFVDTGVEFPEIREFVRTIDNVTWLKPKKTFKQVCQEYGYPVVSKETSQKLHEVRTTKSDFMLQLRTKGVDGRKRHAIPKKWQYLIDAPFKISHKCCYYLKKEPMARYEKETGRVPFIGTMADESCARLQSITAHGCFISGKQPKIRPMSFWTSDDSHLYLKMIPHCVLYDPPFNFTQTGCMFCGYGVDQESPNKFQRMAVTHPRVHRLGLPALGIDKVMEFMGQPLYP